MSLRRRLLIILLVTVGSAWAFLVVTHFFNSRNQIEELLDAEIVQSAQLLLARSTHVVAANLLSDPDTLSIESLSRRDANHTGRYQKDLAFQVWIKNSFLALRSYNAPTSPLSPVHEGFSDEIIANRTWRVFSLQHNNLPILVQVGERYEVRDNLTWQILLRMLAQMTITLPILALMIWYGIRHAMTPIDRIAKEVTFRAPHHLDPILPHRLPKELQPLLYSLNALMERLKKAFDSERRFTADAAHELRTPLAAIKAQAQLALKASNTQDSQDSLRKVIHGVDKATHVVQQLLILARVDPAAPLSDFENVDLCELTTLVMMELVPRALKKNIDISLNETCKGRVQGNADALTILLTNLVDNAINYTQEHGIVSVRVEDNDGIVVLTVADNGPGIPVAERDLVMQRFYRGRHITQLGSGLGLSIVQRICELHHARIALSDSPLGGLKVDVYFPHPGDAGN